MYSNKLCSFVSRLAFLSVLFTVSLFAVPVHGAANAIRDSTLIAGHGGGHGHGGGGGRWEGGGRGGEWGHDRHGYRNYDRNWNDGGDFGIGIYGGDNDDFPDINVYPDDNYYYNYPQ